MTCEENILLDYLTSYLRVNFKEVKEKKNDIICYTATEMRVSTTENGMKVLKVGG